eukprot:352278-Chlamydomonas_euryale.AAC.3
MGRHMAFYVISRDIQHDNTKICHGWECEPEDDNAYKWYCRYPSDVLSDNMKARIAQYRFNEPDEWCSKCKLFWRGFYDSPYTLDSMFCQHSYGNPMVNNKWDVHLLFMGSSDVGLAEKFSSELIREITRDDFDQACQSYADMGACDKDEVSQEAYEETMMVFEFIKKWILNDDVHVILSDDY